MKKMVQIAILLICWIAIFGNPCFAVEGTKVSAKTGVTSAPANDDVLYIVDTSATEGKKIEAQHFKMDSVSSYVVPAAATTVTLNFSVGTIHLVTMNTALGVTFTFSNLPSGVGARVYTIRVTNASGSATATWPASVYPGGVTGTYQMTTGTSNTVDIFRFVYGMNNPTVEWINSAKDMK